MKFKMLLATVALAALSSTAYAKGDTVTSLSPAEIIATGHGTPGEIASTSDHNVTFEALSGGGVKRTNHRFGTVQITHPLLDAHHKDN